MPAKRRRIRIAVFFLSYWIPFTVFSQTPKNLGDLFYARGDYALARIEYERALVSQDKTLPDADVRFSLALLRTGNPRNAFEVLHRPDFASSYLRLYSSLRGGLLREALGENKEAQDRKDFTRNNKEEMTLLASVAYIESRQYARVRHDLLDLHQSGGEQETRSGAGKILQALDQYESESPKSRGLAALLSVLLPGSGQLYAKHYADAISAFLLNLLFLGSAIHMYELERQGGRPHTISAVVGSVGLLFYAANIVGAYASAQRHNLYRERTMHDAVRRSVFHLDRAEQVIGIQFVSPQ